MTSMRARMLMTAWLVMAVAAMSAAACRREAQPREPLNQIFAPRFAHVPPREPASATLHALAAEWRGSAGDTFRADLRSWQAAAALLALGLMLAIGIDYRDWRNPRNVDLLLMYVTGLVLFDSMRFFSHLGSPSYLNLLDWVFTAVVLCSVMLLVRALLRVARPPARAWTPNGRTRVLAAAGTALLAINITLALVRPPDDAGYFVNLGAQRLRERGRLPYGDPMLTGTPGAAYGPLLYAAHVPFLWMAAPEGVNEVSPPRPVLGEQSTYYAPPLVATQWAAVAFHLLGVGALFVAARRMAGARTAWGLVCLYCGSLAILGIGGGDYSVAGITFISHVAPAAMTLLALATLPWPAVSGTMLVLAAAAGFYPAFMGPAWLGYYWNSAAARTRFAVACALTAVVVGGLVIARSHPTAERSRLGTILSDTFGHHTELSGYGMSPFGFWGQREGIRHMLSTPLVGNSGLTTPAWMVFLVLVCGSFFLARGRSPAELALLAASIALASALVKPHATGTYMAWYYGPLLLGLTARSFTSKPQMV
jgi:hypothetical protein